MLLFHFCDTQKVLFSPRTVEIAAAGVVHITCLCFANTSAEKEHLEYHCASYHYAFIVHQSG